MAFIDALVYDPFMVNEQIVDSLLQEPDSFEAWLASRADGLLGSGTIVDPFDASSSSKLDSLMSSFAPYTKIHFASGLYLTNGFAAGVTGGWQPKRGQRIVGAGIDVTTLKLTPGGTAGALYFAIGADDSVQVNEFEASDMTIDCNLAGQSAAVAAGAIKVYGTHIRIRRIRAIHFGTQTTAQRGVAIVTAGAFPDDPEPFDCVVEDCILDLPFLNNVRETACITFAGGERQSDGVMAYHKGCVVRNCFIDCKYSNNEVPISTISFSNSVTGIVVTKIAHNLLANQWIVISGALINGVLPNDINGSFTVTQVDSPTQFRIVSANVQPANPTGDMYISRPPSQRVAISGLSVSGTVATLTTATPHNRLPGQNVLLNNVLVSGSPANAFNASFPITQSSQIVSPTVLQFTISPNPGTPTVTNAWIGVDFSAVVTNGGRGVIVEGNRILNTTFGLSRDTWGTKDMVVRDNYFYNVLAAIYEKMGQVSGGDANQQPARLGSTLTQNGALAVFTTTQPHGFSVGMPVSVAGALVGGSLLNPFNGVFQIATVPSPTSFTYAMSTDPGANALGSITANGQSAASLVRNKTLATFTTSAPHGLSFHDAVAVAGAAPSPYNGTFAVASVPGPTSFTYIMGSDPASNASGSFAFGALWQVGRLVIENNIIELVLTITSGVDPPTCIRLDRRPSTPAAPASPYIFGQVVIRGNVVRHVDNASDPTAIPLAISLNSCEAAIIEENVIKLDRTHPMEFTACGAVKFFNNQGVSGALIQGYDAVAAQFVNELTTDADLSALLAT